MNQPTNRAPQTVTALDNIEISADVESAIAQMQATGKDTGALTQTQRAGYVTALCRALRLNPLTNPVQFIKLNGREVLYVTRTATDQLAAMHGLNRKTVRGPEVVDIGGQKVALCVVEVTLPSGRSETATATLPVTDPASLYMKLETKAKRRGTLAILGLGLLAEEEAESIPGAERVEPEPRETPAQRKTPRDLALEALAVDIEAADTARALRVCYLSLVEGLRAAGVATEDMAPVLRDGAAQIGGALSGLALHLSEAEMTALLATDGEALARALDTLLTVLRGIYDADMVARWWINVRADLGRDVGAACYRVATRALASDENDPASVRKAGESLKRSIARLDQPPPTGTDAPASGANDGATASASHAPAESSAAAHASRERIASAGGVRAYLRTKGSRREIELAVRAHGRYVPGLAQIAAERLDAITPADNLGTRPTPETLRRDCERWASEGPLARVLRAA